MQLRETTLIYTLVYVCCHIHGVRPTRWRSSETPPLLYGSMNQEMWNSPFL